MLLLKLGCNLNYAFAAVQFHTFVHNYLIDVFYMLVSVL